MRADEKFRIGDQVMLNSKSAAYRDYKPRFGVVVGYGRDRSQSIRVREDGLTSKGNAKYPNTWHMDYWDKLETGAMNG